MNLKPLSLIRYSLSPYVLSITFLVIIGAACYMKPKLNSDKKPNFIIILCDDVGYGDFSTNGHPTIQTPHVDKLAREGQKWTNFYAASSVCTPSRAGLLTGRLPVRSGMAGTQKRVMMPWSTGGIPASEETIGECLQGAGYETAVVGKWHVGHAEEQFLPKSQGFNYSYICPLNIDHYGCNGWNWNDYEEHKDSLFKKEFYCAPFFENGKEVSERADPTIVTKTYTEKTQAFIRANKEKPFFVFLSHSMAHVPLFTSEAFRNASKRGLYGDVIQEMDWGVGEILKTLKEEGLDENTIVAFTSDNGPWLLFEEFGGSAGMLKGGKAELFEGGFRVPFVIWGPKHIQPGVQTGIGNMMDLLPTICNLAGAELPGTLLDGHDLSQALLEGEKSPNDEVFYYRFSTLYAVRKGDYKCYFKTYHGLPWKNETDKIQELETPELYNVNHDPSEKFNIAQGNSAVIEELRKVFEKQQASVVPVENQVDKYSQAIFDERQKLYARSPGEKI